MLDTAPFLIASPDGNQLYQLAGLSGETLDRALKLRT